MKNAEAERVREEERTYVEKLFMRTVNGRSDGYSDKIHFPNGHYQYSRCGHSVLEFRYLSNEAALKLACCYREIMAEEKCKEAGNAP